MLASRGVSASLPILLLSGMAPAAPFQVEGHLATDTGYDSNVYRNFEGSGFDPTLPGNGAVVGDAFLQLDGDLDVVGRFFAHQRTELSADVGARLFSDQGGEDAVAGSGSLVHEIALSRKVALRFDAEGKDKWVENDDRAFATWGANGGLSLGPFWRTRLDLRAGWQAFDYFPEPIFSEQGPSVAAILSARPFRRHTFFASYRLMPQTYVGPQQILPSGQGVGQRFDWYHVASAGWALRGPVIAGVTYSFTDDRSDAYGESFLRHRLQLLAGFSLPWELTLVASAALQFTSYPDGLYLSPQILLLEDDDDLDSVTVKLSRDLGKGFDVEARVGYYRNDLFQNGLAYERAVAYVGACWRH